MQQLLPREFTAKPNIQKAIIIEFENKKTSILLKKFSDDEYFTTKNLTHLKRIRKSSSNPQNIQFFLRLKEDFNEELEKSLPEEIKPYELIEMDVVVNNPKTKEQYICFNKYWPITFKVQSYEIAQFSPSEITEINNTMRKCIEAAKQSYNEGNKFNACAIYDPVKKQILEIAGDQTLQKQASIQHCVMNVMKKFGDNFIVTAQQKHLLDKPKPIDTLISESKSKSDISKSKEVEESKEKEDKGINIKRKSEESVEDSLTSYYYCTGLDLYIVQEPCIMCSMALIHSRVRRVFYSIKNEQKQQFGGLNEEIMINHMDTLNHSFLVFQNVLSDLTQETIQTLNNSNNSITQIN